MRWFFLKSILLNKIFSFWKPKIFFTEIFGIPKKPDPGLWGIERYSETSKLLNKKRRVAAGPDGSSIYCCHEKKNIRMSLPVEYDTLVTGKVVSRVSRVRYKSFNVWCHTVAFANKLNVLSTLISKLNAKSTAKQAVMNPANISQDKNLWKKRKQRLLKREKNHLVISHKKLQSYYCFKTDVNWSHHNHPALHEDMLTHPLLLQNQYKKNLISKNPFISQILFYSFLHLRILLSIFQHQQEI